MATALVTGSGGLVGSDAVRSLVEAGFDVVGVENDMRARFFGPEASTDRVSERLEVTYPDRFQRVDLDVRDADGIDRLVARHGRSLELVIHAAAQPSHDWAATEPLVDFDVNARGTLVLLEALRRHASAATFVFLSTNKVYGDTPNRLPLVESATRLDLPEDHPYYDGVDTSMGVDRCLHSLFGVSKASADLLVQEYGRYFDMPTVAFRCGCITGPNHAGAQLHGFLSYLMRCTVAGRPYTVFGYGGKQVRDNIHSSDLARAFLAFHSSPQAGAVYNMGGGRASSCSMLEAIASCERIADRSLVWSLSEDARKGDHRWWISDVSDFQRDYPSWSPSYDVEAILEEIHEENVELWSSGR